ncbi:hypothetical protein PENARI_c118G04762 [Penicillium arizonense]|uniref:SHSP domain-containing protein n=1 Tax=Penicillium arizonense TaxID=1835702 RepID=A0A1F5L0X5_PENAI|nr:hypothetical protein PENARI_c131G07409 [Penicillium arizonense]XP_022482196.1 hypothetical protein PENARI_c126G12191 [Penicillium arizonense]XP_022482200.1 hypothetical protein PENARI_c125G08738 [Penicillium arizonense]XP_022482227.1 hypothetical protein PENARI_c118G04762 [Penicillium arizonense]OGE46706.1 hypothetical protein PENARI_c131G07409 [Penicillium arizonense]OGE46728.1 hypothetical protein PENARI_c126G12191 [Penicillium arizonense]OGE46732.1 hypothetical protein PENARI_c125G08738
MNLLRVSLPSCGDFSHLFRLLDHYDVHRSNRSRSAASSFFPRLDVRESGDSYHLDGELPGLAQKDTDIEFSDPQTLIVKGHTALEYQTSRTDLPIASGPASDRSANSNALPHFRARVDQDNVKASLKNGILFVLVPKTAAPAIKKITIE